MRIRSPLSGRGSTDTLATRFVVTEDSDEPVVGLIFDCESDGEEIYLGSFEAGGFAGELVVLGE